MKGGLSSVSFSIPAPQWHMTIFGRVFDVFNLTKSLFNWKTVGILAAVKFATLAVVIGLARGSLLPHCFPHRG